MCEVPTPSKQKFEDWGEEMVVEKKNVLRKQKQKVEEKERLLG